MSKLFLSAAVLMSTSGKKKNLKTTLSVERGFVISACAESWLINLAAQRITLERLLIFCISLWQLTPPCIVFPAVICFICRWRDVSPHSKAWSDQWISLARTSSHVFINGPCCRRMCSMNSHCPPGEENVWTQSLCLKTHTIPTHSYDSGNICEAINLWRHQ